MTDDPADPQPTPRYQAILTAAPRRAQELGHGHVGAEHLLLALMDDRWAIATQVIERFVPRQTVVSDLLTLMASESYNARGPQPPGPE